MNVVPSKRNKKILPTIVIYTYSFMVSLTIVIHTTVLLFLIHMYSEYKSVQLIHLHLGILFENLYLPLKSVP